MGVFSIILRIGAIIFVVEALIMVGFWLSPVKFSPQAEAVLDAVLLTLISAVPLLVWVVRPYVASRQAVRAAEYARLHSESQLADILDAVVDGIVTSDSQGRIQVFNPAAEKIFGYSAEEVVGESINILMPPVEARRHDTYLDKYHRTGEAHIIGFGREVMGRRKDGSEFPLDLAISQVEIEGERYYTGVVRDITERKKAEQALIEAKNEAERANRVKSEFMANMSHELRTPLNAIIGFSEVSRAEMFGPLGNEKYKEYAADVQDSAQHLLDLINDILDMARIEADKLELNDEVFDIAEIVKTPIHLVDTGKLTIVNTVPHDLPLLCADQRRVKQILLNLLSNAVKFTPEGGEVVVEGHATAAGGIELCVRDNGIGMDPLEIECALRPFEQIDTGLDRKYEGTGLGLPLVDRLARLNGAELKLESRPGEGTCARVVFEPARTVSRRAGGEQDAEQQVAPAG